MENKYYSVDYSNNKLAVKVCSAVYNAAKKTSRCFMFKEKH